MIGGKDVVSARSVDILIRKINVHFLFPVIKHLVPS